MLKWVHFWYFCNNAHVVQQEYKIKLISCYITLLYNEVYSGICWLADVN